MSTRLLRGAALVAAFVPFALALVPAPALGKDWQPSVSWSSYLGGAQVDELRDAVTNADDDIFVVGQTDSTSGFPADAGLPMSSTGRDAFIAKFKPDGTLAWARVFGGSGADLARRVQLVPDGSGDVFVVGTLTEVWGEGWIHTSFTTILAPVGMHSYKGGESDAFLARVSADGELLWFIFVGGRGKDDGVSLAVTETTVYVGGRTKSDSASFSGAKTVGTRGLFTEASDAFVSQVDLIHERSPKIPWTRFIGTTATVKRADNTAYALLVKAPDVYVAGIVNLSFNESGITPIKDFHQGDEDGFVAKLKPTGDMEWFTHVGSAGPDDSRELLAVPEVAGLIVVGRTSSPGFPRSGTGGGGADTYVLRLREDGVRVPGGVRVGTDGNEEVAQAAVDALGNVFVGGRTTSSDLDQNAFDTTYTGGQEGFVAMVDAALTQPIWVSYVGGNNTDPSPDDPGEWVRAMVAGPQGRLTLVGSSNADDVLRGPVGHDPKHNGSLDGFLFRLEVDPSAPSAGQVEASLSETGISATWGFSEPSRNFTDPETGIHRYEWAIGHSGQRDNVQPFTSVKTLTEASTSFEPQVGLPYSVTVRAFNGVNRPSEEVSFELGTLAGSLSPLGWGCGSTGGGGLVGALGLVALASLLARRARRASGSGR
ncbi:MAG TPA: hypothetical protein VEY88_23735 [Archangium sp.]|nr:hypothetical protein [Archangium sp.]